MNLHRRSRYFWPILLTILTNIGLAMPPTRYGAAFALLWLLPGLAWAGLLAGWHRRPTAEEVAVGLGLGMGTVVVLTLVLYYIPGPLTFPTLLVTVNMLVLAFILVTPHPSIWNLGFGIRDLVICPLSFIISIAALFRLLYLGYSEFQGDEGIVMMRAARAILGDDAQLFYHQKGPAEVLLPIATWTLSGTINEWQARLPFAFASLLGIAGLYLLSRRWFNGWSGLIAALLLAINGYFIGFGRIVQYQSLVLAATTLALLALWRWSEGEGHRWLIAGAALLAFGLLAHYDAGLVLPAAVYTVGRRLWRTRSRWRTLRADVLSAALLALGILALFYLPFVRNPNFAKTLGYLSGARIGTKEPLYNNLLSSLPLATFY
nr:phospholipid carrier-dependent glycosyltransferase [Anaerolineae bacterium]